MTEQQGQTLLLAWDAIQNAILMRQMATSRALPMVRICYDAFRENHQHLDLVNLEQIELDLLRLANVDGILQWMDGEDLK